MNANPTNQSPDAFHNQLKVFGDAWMLIIVSELLNGTCRFNELQRKVCGISPVTLTNRLKKLETLGIITRTEGKEDQLAVSYCVSEKGLAMKPVLKAIHRYGDTYFAQLQDCEKTCEPAND